MKYYSWLALLMLSAGTAKGAAPSYVELHDAPAINVDWSKGDTQIVMLHGDRTIRFQNGVKGTKYVLIIEQNSTEDEDSAHDLFVSVDGDTRSFVFHIGEAVAR